MKSFFEAVWDGRGGIFVLLVCFLVLLASLAWFARLISTTFFSSTAASNQSAASDTPGKVGFILANLFVKLITDFRHLLALVLVLVFSGVLIYAIHKVEPTDADGLSKALQAVMSTLGGLVGSIVGYYFGESAGLRSNGLPTPVTPVQSAGDLQQISPGSSIPHPSAMVATVPSTPPTPASLPDPSITPAPAPPTHPS